MNNKFSLFNKIFVIGIIILFVGMVVNPSSGIILDKKFPNPISNGRTLYVGGTGPGNYTSIQAAINEANDGDTVFVFDESSPYVENVILNKVINLVGEDKNSTVIDGNFGESVISIDSDGVYVKGFTIQNSIQDGYYLDYYCGVDIRSNNNIIKENIISNNFNGISIGRIDSEPHLYNNVIEDNIIIENNWGITIFRGNNNLLLKNFIKFNGYGIRIYYHSKDNLITLNNISQNKYGILTNAADNITILKNSIFENEIGVYVSYSSNFKVIENNIFSNVKGLFFVLFSINFRSNWINHKFDANYWGKDKQPPIIIEGKMHFLRFHFKIFKIDKNPALKLYDI